MSRLLPLEPVKRLAGAHHKHCAKGFHPLMKCDCAWRDRLDQGMEARQKYRLSLVTILALEGLI